jgi:hypothetical protein
MVRASEPRFGIVAELDHDPPGDEPGAHLSGSDHDSAGGEYRTRFDASSDVDAVKPMGRA